MDRTCRSHVPLAFLFWAGIISVGIGWIASADEPTPRIKKLVDASTEKRAFQESGLLNENPLQAGDIPEALAYIKTHADYTSYHLLLAVRKYHPASYKDVANDDKAAILCSALANSIFLNDWGYLDPSESYDGESAKALLETGKVALKSLTPMLADGKEAPLFGSEEATMSHVYKYRRKDFAARYAAVILGLTPTFSRDLKERDRDIEALKAKLPKDAK
jgi:hypothetical protein